MKGMIFNLLEDFIVEGWGPERFEKIMELCPVHAQVPYVGPGTYPDANLMSIIEKTTAELGLGNAEALRRFGRFAFPKLAQKFSVYTQNHRHPKTFLKAVDGVIHVEVRKLFANAEPPRITFEDPAPDRLILHYNSRRQLCPFFAGLVEGCGDFYKVPIAQAQVECAREGAPSCQFALHFPG